MRGGGGVGRVGTNHRRYYRERRKETLEMGAGKGKKAMKKRNGACFWGDSQRVEGRGKERGGGYGKQMECM